MATRLDPALNPDIFGMQPKPLRGGLSRDAGQEVLAEKQTPLQKEEAKLQQTESEIAKGLKETAELAGSQALFKAEQAGKEARGKSDILATQAKTMREAEAPIRVAEEERMRARFEPTQENATEMAALYSLVGVLGFAIGRGGKQSAMNAMNAMNGMLEGYRKGSTDRYNSEKRAFDANLKNLSDTVNTLTTRLNRVAQLAAIDKAAAEQELSVTLAENGADFVKQNINKIGLTATLQYLQQVKSATERAISKEREFVAKSDAAAERAREQAIRDRDRQDFMRMMQRERLDAQAQRDAGKKDGKLISENQLVKLEGLQSISDGLKQLKKDFNNKYAGLGIPIVGAFADFEIEARRRLGDVVGAEAARWWSRYQRLQAPNRHALFGATLTGNELKNYQSFTAKPADSAEVVSRFLDDQIAYSDDVKNTRMQTFQDAGYVIPTKKPSNFDSTYQVIEFNTVEEAEAANLPKGTRIKVGGKLATVE